MEKLLERIKNTRLGRLDTGPGWIYVQEIYRTLGWTQVQNGCMSRIDTGPGLIQVKD